MAEARRRVWITCMVALLAAGPGCAIPEPIPMTDASVYRDMAGQPRVDSGLPTLRDGTYKGLEMPPWLSGDSDGRADMGFQMCPPTDAHVDGICGWTRDGSMDGVGDGRAGQDGLKKVDGVNPPSPDGLKKKLDL